MFVRSSVRLRMDVDEIVSQSVNYIPIQGWAQGSFVEAEARQVDVVCVVLISCTMRM